MNLDLKNLREEYSLDSIDISLLPEDPIELFKVWLQVALKSPILEPNAFTLATVGSDGSPSARIVLLKEIEKDGFIFYTNYESRKAQEMAINKKVAGVFSWVEVQKQIRLEGMAQKISTEQSEIYFQSRPRESQVGAWASPQSTVLESRSELESRFALIEKKFSGREVLPCPPNWGGFKIFPSKIEFWQGRRSRLHDRVNYTLQNGQFIRQLLAP